MLIDARQRGVVELIYKGKFCIVYWDDLECVLEQIEGELLREGE